MIVFMVFIGASSPGCEQPASRVERVRAWDDPCPIGRFPSMGEYAGCECPEGQIKRHVGAFDFLTECDPLPVVMREEPVVDIECADPPASCAYEGRILSGSASEVSCGTLVCPEPTCSIHCTPPPANCRYVGQLASGPCGKVTCGKLVCTDHPRCRDGERRFETCWSGGARGQARHTCRDGRWHRDACELPDELEEVSEDL